MSIKKQTPFERVGGKPMIAKVAKIFYDKVYMHQWIGQYFAAIPQEHIESQQTDFMCDLLGGPRQFSGRMPGFAHEHMHISDELFELRNQLLKEAMVEVGIEEEMQAFWLKIDESFRKVIVKKRSECKKRYFTDTVLDFPNPNPLKKIA